MSITQAKIGTTLENMEYVESLAGGTMRPPTMDYQPAVRRERLANGQIRLLGLPRATWEFVELTPEMIDALRAYCSGGSVSVYIQTRTNRNDDEYKVFSAVMIWPEDESLAHFQRRREKFILEFRDLELA